MAAAIRPEKGNTDFALILADHKELKAARNELWQLLSGKKLKKKGNTDFALIFANQKELKTGKKGTLICADQKERARTQEQPPLVLFQLVGRRTDDDIPLASSSEGSEVRSWD